MNLTLWIAILLAFTFGFFGFLLVLGCCCYPQVSRCISELLKWDCEQVPQAEYVLTRGFSGRSFASRGSGELFSIRNNLMK